LKFFYKAKSIARWGRKTYGSRFETAGLPIGVSSLLHFSSHIFGLDPVDWRSGENLWLIDLCVPFGGGEFILKELRENVFKEQKVKMLQPAPDGSGMAVVEW
jgi:hypothetical protein